MMKWLQGFWKFLNRPLSKGKKPPEIPKIPEEKVAKEVFVKPSKETLNIQVGLDFGTNSTKVCYSIIGSTSKVYPLLFGHNLAMYPSYIFPSAVAFGSNGELLFGDEALKILDNSKWGYGLRNFKTLLAGQHDDSFKDSHSEEIFYDYVLEKGLDPKIIRPDVITSAYLIHVINRARSIIKSKFSNSNLDLNFNICIPVDYVQRNAVKGKFEHVFAVSEYVERILQNMNGKIDSVEEILNCIDKVKYDENNPETRIFGIPEAVGEVASYLKSSRRKDGLHALIDLGSGTTDVSIFNFTRFREEKTWWYAARAIPYGMFRIEKIIANYMKNNRSAVTNKEMNRILNELSNKKNSLSDLRSEIRIELDKFSESKEYRGTWGSAYGHLKKESAWDDVTVFVSGGGSQLPFVKGVLSTPWWGHMADKRYNVEVLSVPHDFETKKSIPFHRMAVAYGLTIPKPMLATYILPNDAPDHTPARRPVKTQLDREELYPK